MFAIEKDITPPATYPAAPSNAYYGFERLEPGDSFLVPCEGPDRQIAARRVRWAIKHYRRKNGTTWRTKTVSKGVRIWRIT
jgi:hypothetical protein